MGPRSRELLQRVSTADFSTPRFPFGDIREIDLGYATVRATRLTYVGELGWELYVPVEFAVGVYEALHGSGRRSRRRQRRLLRDRLAAAREGLSRMGPRAVAGHQSVRGGSRFAVKLDKPAVSRARRAGGGRSAASVKRRRIVSLVIDAPHTNVWGGELILRDGTPVGSVTSAAFGHTIGKPVALGLITRPTVRPIGPGSKAAITRSIWPANGIAAAVSLKAPYDPESRRVKS